MIVTGLLSLPLKPVCAALAAMALIALLGACSHGHADADEAWTAAERIRAGLATPDEIRALADTALEARLDPDRFHVSWGDVLDAALASGTLDPARRERAYSEAILVDWFGHSERTDQQGKPIPSHLLFRFIACVGPMSALDYDAEILDATLDGKQVEFSPEQERPYYFHVPNARPGDTFQHVALPIDANGKTLRVHWRVRIFDAVTKQPLAPDWDHTEPVRIPGHAASFEGRRPRDPAP